jgi:hypothetical protein
MIQLCLSHLSKPQKIILSLSLLFLGCFSGLTQTDTTKKGYRIVQKFLHRLLLSIIGLLLPMYVFKMLFGMSLSIVVKPDYCVRGGL